MSKRVREISFPCLRAEQPIGDIFVGVISHSDLRAITFSDVRRVLQDERDFERYLGIQRPLDDKRVKSLVKYVNSYDATFPTSIIIAIDQEFVAFNSKTNVMTISNATANNLVERDFDEIARVLDGQHRIAGLEGYDGEQPFDLSVTIFVGTDIADQAQIFATVNLEQTKVNKSLAYDLYELARTRSPQKTCHNVVVALDQEESSPFYRRIKRLGLARDDGSFQPVTQATLVESMLPMMSQDPKADRDALLRGRSLRRGILEEDWRYPLRSFFIEDRDLDVATLFYNYFCAVRERWPVAWASRERGWMLNRTNGVRALMRFFPDAYAGCGGDGNVISQKRFESRIFSKIDLNDSEFNVDMFVPGTSGESKLLRTFRDQLKA